MLRCILKHHIVPNKVEGNSVRTEIEKSVYSVAKKTEITVDHTFRDEIKIATASFLNTCKRICSSKTSVAIVNSTDYHSTLISIVLDTYKFEISYCNSKNILVFFV